MTVEQLPTAASFEPWLTKAEVARILGVSEKWIQRRMKGDNPIPHRHRGRHVRFRLSAIEEWEQSQ